jgi:hypothetical protein
MTPPSTRPVGRVMPSGPGQHGSLRYFRLTTRTSSTNYNRRAHGPVRADLCHPRHRPLPSRHRRRRTARLPRRSWPCRTLRPSAHGARMTGTHAAGSVLAWWLPGTPQVSRTPLTPGVPSPSPGRVRSPPRGLPTDRGATVSRWLRPSTRDSPRPESCGDAPSGFTNSSSFTIRPCRFVKQARTSLFHKAVSLTSALAGEQSRRLDLAPPPGLPPRLSA